MNKENLKIDISSTAIEKGLDIAKDFLEKLIIPSVEETGLLLKEKVTLWKFKNQVRTLNKAQEYCLKHNISPKSISLKLLCPLLDNSAIEEDEYLQNKWSILLGNMVDSEQNIVFPFLLGQISKNELVTLEKNYFLNQENIRRIESELDRFRKEKPSKESELKKKILEFQKNNPNKLKEKWKLESQLRNLKYKEGAIISQFSKLERLSEKELQEFEIYNRGQ